MLKRGDDMDTKKIQLVTFDLDGTMLDDEWAHAEANRRLGIKLGVDHTRLGRLTGYSVRRRWEELCRLADVEADIEEIAREHFAITLEIVKAERIPEAPSLTPTLQTLRERGYRMAIVSSSDESFVREVADYLKVTPYIDFFVTQNQVKNLKPAPDIYQYALAQAGVPACCAVGVEDSEPGTLALHRAEMFTVGFLNEGKNHQVLEQTDAQIQRMDQLLPLLEQLEQD